MSILKYVDKVSCILKLEHLFAKFGPQIDKYAHFEYLVVY